MPVRATVVRRFWYESHVLFVSNMCQELECSDTTPHSHAARRAEGALQRLDEDTPTIALAAAPTFLSSLNPPALK